MVVAYATVHAMYSIPPNTISWYWPMHNYYEFRAIRHCQMIVNIISVVLHTPQSQVGRVWWPMIILSISARTLCLCHTHAWYPRNRKRPSQVLLQYFSRAFAFTCVCTGNDVMHTDSNLKSDWTQPDLVARTTLVRMVTRPLFPYNWGVWHTRLKYNVLRILWCRLHY